MPLHLNSITNDEPNTEALAWILREGMDECDSVFVSDDQQFFHLRSKIIDKCTGQPIGRMVYTIKNGEDVLEIKDLDIVWNNDTATRLHFNRLRDGSSDANEYYEVENSDEQHLEIETVNRHVIPEELLNTERDVFVSAFPFELSVYQNIDAFNRWAGFKDEISVKGLDIKVGGYSDKFLMPGGLFNEKKKSDESYTFLIGTVLSYRDVEIAFGDASYPFVLAQVDTGLGVIPVSMGRDVFELEDLQVGSVVAMNADIKADLAKDGDYSFPKTPKD